MKKRKIIVVVNTLLILFILSGCGLAKAADSGVPKDHAAEEVSEWRTVVDLTGAEVNLPPADQIENVLIISPPLLATYINVVGDTGKIVGVHPFCFSNANGELLNLTVKNKDRIRTDFINGFTSNAEEVLKMNPDVILLYGEFQKEGLENVDVPLVNFFTSNAENETWSVAVDGLMREVFEVSESQSLQTEWDQAKEIVNLALGDLKEEDQKTAVMIMNNTAEVFTVRGGNSFGDDWLDKSGLINVADEIQGDNAQISMEQMYKWNPDVIFIFRGANANEYLSNEIEGQDWSGLKAFEKKQIYDMPQGMMNWGAPNVDSPISLMWMTMKSYPESIDQNFYNQYMKEYYQRQYKVDLSDELLEAILNP
jgi:iron complex transport system substrate-binding protein